jgi:hypothetical protein
MKGSISAFRLCLCAALASVGVLSLTGAPAQATWSIVITDSRTGEVAIGQASCVAGIDLEFYTPVTVTNVGAATVAGYVDASGMARTIIRNELYAGTPPQQILDAVSAGDPEHETHQYCIVDVVGRAVTYSGTVAQAQFDFWGGIAGKDGDVAYSVTGGLLTGAPVIQQAVQAILDTDGSVGDKLMASMQAARAMGGDGRCSCSPTNPTGCGSPPSSFDAAAINGYVLWARAGDTADCIQCSSADLYMNLNVAYQPSGATDPVIVLQGMYDSWRADLDGRPDAVRSPVTLDPPVLPADGVSSSLMTITLLDLDGSPIGVPISSVRVRHGLSSDGISSIGPVIDNGGGVYTTEITSGTETGVDRFLIVVNDGIRAVQLMPEPELSIGSLLEVQNVGWPDRNTMTWDPSPAVVEYHLYGGDVTELDCTFSGLCLDDRDPIRTDTSFVDTVAPLPGECFFYLVSGEDSGGNESGLGSSFCGERLNAFPC